MKKYIQPEILIQEIELKPLMDGSNPDDIVVDPDNPGIDPGGFDAPKWMGLDDEEDEDEIIHTF